MKDRHRWNWHRSLATVDEGHWAEVGVILLGSARRRLAAFGVERGSRVKCLVRTPEFLVLENESGERGRLDRPHSWFVSAISKPKERVGPRA